MASCEKCWSESENTDQYHELLKIRKCTPEEQAGEESGFCPVCERKTIHQYAKSCVICGINQSHDWGK